MPRLETLTERPSEHKAMPDEQFETWLANEETVLRGGLERISPAELANIKLMWRGMNGEDIFDFLEGKAPSIHLDSYRPNATTDPHKAISYIGDSRLSFNCAIGFMPRQLRLCAMLKKRRNILKSAWMVFSGTSRMNTSGA